MNVIFRSSRIVPAQTLPPLPPPVTGKVDLPLMVGR
jgi:hypothetical protein